MSEILALLITDVVDSTELNSRWGDAVMARLWAAHDRAARELMRSWHGREVGRSDGFLVLFAQVHEAVSFALAYHQCLAALTPQLRARVGVHLGPIVLRQNSSADTAQGATPFEIDGVALPVAARVMAAALGGQTLLSDAAFAALGPTPRRTTSHGFWRLKGLTEPVEIFEVGAADAPFMPPPDSAKAYRVVRSTDEWVPLHQVANNLPAERDAFIGRRDALQELCKRFDEGARLISLLGIGGLGKTRLALRYARTWLGEYPGGAWFCDLSSSRSRDGIAHAVAQGLNVPLGKAEPVQLLGAAIAGRGRCLVILDNFEQVARFAEETLGTWLGLAPDARFIVTSRELLGIAGEHALVLAPLDNAEAVQLFRLRVRAAGVQAPFDGQDEAAISPLAELLDRLPLAIELAAARARLMPPQILLQRMGDRFKLLAARAGRHDRQATLRAALDWSWDLLSPEEKSALAQLSVFEGGFTLEAAEAVVAPSSEPGQAWIADTLQSLIDKSLVLRLHAHRFGLLRTVHEYAAEHLAANATAHAEGAARRHWRYFAARTEAQITAERCVESENVITACARASRGEPEAAATVLLNAWAVLKLTGPFHVASALARPLLQVPTLTDRQRAFVGRVLGAALSLQGQGDEAREQFLAAAAHARAAGDAGLQAQLICLGANLDIAAGRFDQVEAALISEPLMAGAAVDRSALLMAVNARGSLAFSRSQLDLAQRHFGQALELAESLGDRRWQGGLHGNLGSIGIAQGRLVEGRAHLQASLDVALELADHQWEGNARCNMGLLLHELGEHEAARAELQTALQIARTTGHRRLEATVLSNLGLACEALAEFDAALAQQREAVAIAAALRDQRLEAELQGHLSRLLARQNKPLLNLPR